MERPIMPQGRGSRSSEGLRGLWRRWRRRRDSNPRYSFPYDALAKRWFQPLTHVSERRTPAYIGRRRIVQQPAPDTLISLLSERVPGAPAQFVGFLEAFAAAGATGIWLSRATWASVLPLQAMYAGGGCVSGFESALFCTSCARGSGARQPGPEPGRSALASGARRKI